MDVFISYSNKDIEKVRQLCARLAEDGISYWVAHENTDFGDQYAATIIRQIEEAQIFLVVVSKSSNLSTHVINEINSAVMRNKKIVSVLLEEIKLSPAMEYYLASTHYLIYKDDASFFEQLTGRIGDLLGKKCEKEDGDSQSIIARLAEDGDAAALYEAGKQFYYGKGGMKKNLVTAFECFLKAAEMGHAAAQNNVAWCYESGDGTEQNWSKALEWYTKSAENGCAIAQYSLAWMYDNGIEVKKNISKAIVWHIRAAENGYAMSQYKLGLAYLEGTVVDQNPIIANHWLMLAADQGVVFAQYKLAENYYFGIGCKRDVIKAKTMWILASNKGYSKAEEALEKYYDIYYNSDDKSFII